MLVALQYLAGNRSECQLILKGSIPRNTGFRQSNFQRPGSSPRRKESNVVEQISIHVHGFLCQGHGSAVERKRRTSDALSPLPAQESTGILERQAPRAWREWPCIRRYSANDYNHSGDAIEEHGL